MQPERKVQENARLEFIAKRYVQFLMKEKLTISSTSQNNLKTFCSPLNFEQNQS